MAPPVLLHGDVHHLNILAGGNGEWRLIDAKGLIGEPAYEVGTFLQNPRRLFARADPALAPMLARRLDILSEELGIDRERLRRWGLAQSVLSAWWSYEDHGHGWEPAMLAARLLAELG
jgi:streptomycin 6-kinase